MVAKRKDLMKQLLGDIFAQEEDSEAGIKFEGKHIEI